jgi:hypothetical protein
VCSADQIGAVVQCDLRALVEHGVDVAVVCLGAFAPAGEEGIPCRVTSAAATSSWVLSGLLAQSAKLAPPADSTRAKLAVSAVICKHPPMRAPSMDFASPKRCIRPRSKGISANAQSIRRAPDSAKARSATSCLSTVRSAPPFRFTRATAADLTRPRWRQREYTTDPDTIAHFAAAPTFLFGSGATGLG